MKTIITILLTLTVCISSQAQDLTFEQTVAYIQKNVTGRMMYPGDLDAYSRTRGYTLKDLSIKQNGAIVLKTDQKWDNHDFEISFNLFDLIQKVDYPEGIRAYKFLVHFNGLNVSGGYGITFATDAEAERVARAFRHLKSVCIKDEDPFSKPTVIENTPDLNKEETITYIANKLKEVEGQYRGYSFGNAIFHDLSFTKSKTKDGYFILEYRRYAESDHSDRVSLKYEFDIKNITSLELNSPKHGKGYNAYGVSSPIGMLEIVLINNTGLLIVNDNSGAHNITESQMSFPFLQSNSGNLKKIIKALEHLRNLSDDENDPFGK